MNEAILLAFADVDESGINSWENILDPAEIDVANLIATLSYDQFINTFVVEHSGDAQLLRDDDLLGHGG